MQGLEGNAGIRIGNLHAYLAGLRARLFCFDDKCSSSILCDGMLMFVVPL